LTAKSIETASLTVVSCRLAWEPFSERRDLDHFGESSQIVPNREFASSYHHTNILSLRAPMRLLILFLLKIDERISPDLNRYALKLIDNFAATHCSAILRSLCYL
jgi:hypothetical protein